MESQVLIGILLAPRDPAVSGGALIRFELGHEWARYALRSSVAAVRMHVVNTVDFDPLPFALKGNYRRVITNDVCKKASAAHYDGEQQGLSGLRNSVLLIGRNPPAMCFTSSR